MVQHVLWRRFACLCGILLIAASSLVPSSAEAARVRSLHAGKDVKGITFEEFWAKARDEGTKWAGRRLRVRRIISVPVVGFDGRNGRSPVWEAQLVRCDRAQSTDEEEAPSRICRGRSITVRLVESGVKGAEPGTHVSKEKPFRGPSIPEERIAINPQRAEEAANKHRQYTPAEVDSYSYELRYDHRNDRPLWVIKRTCGYRGKSEGRCQPGDHWITKVDAESGEIAK
jgi:hypothetical protein